MQSSEETRLIGEAQAGDRTAFEALVRHYDRSVLRMALRLVRSHEEARDIYQETFLRFYRSLGRFRRECSLETYLYRIVTSVCVDHLRRRAARPETVFDLTAREGALDPILDRPDQTPDHDPERALARREIRHRIEAALGGLAPRERIVFEMRHYEGRRLREIGDLIGTSEDTVKNCLFRAHQNLREALGDLGGLRMPGLRGRPDSAQVGARG